jgi:hypothetical protein
MGDGSPAVAVRFITGGSAAETLRVNRPTSGGKTRSMSGLQGRKDDEWRREQEADRMRLTEKVRAAG